MYPIRALVLVNREARAGRERAREAVTRLRDLGLWVLEESTSRPERVAEAVRRHRHQVDRVIVGGGDGTLNRVLAPLLEADLPLGILPLGTANNAARALGIPFDLAGACEVAAGSHTRRVDLGLVNGRHFLTAASLGLGVAITERLRPGAKRRWGVAAYALAALRGLSVARPFRAEILWEGGVLRTRAVQIVVGNGRYYGAALPVAEDAAIDDQRLDLYAVEARHWWELVTLVPALTRGRQGRKRSVQTIRARELEIRTPVPRAITVDGEPGPSTPARFSLLPRALSVLCPRPAPPVAAAA